MPAISEFYGITIYMYFLDNRQHHSPHIHAYYQDEAVVVRIPYGKVLEGRLNRRKLRLVQAWIDIRREELLSAWALAVEGRSVDRIEPLS